MHRGFQPRTGPTPSTPKDEKPARRPPKPRVKVDVYRVVSDAVEAGVARGLRRAYKHSDEPLPDADAERIREHVHNEIMNELSEVVRWE